MLELLRFISYLLTLYIYILIASAVMSWLIVFNVLNIHSPGVRAFVNAINRVTEPMYRPIRRILPDFGGIDFSPLIVIILIAIAHRLLTGAETSLITGSL